MNPQKRNALLLALGSVLAGYFFFREDAFWAVFGSGLIAVWALFMLLPMMDAGWRFKAGFIFSVAIGAVVVLLPTIETLSIPASASGEPPKAPRVKIPAYVRDHIKFGIVKGLDLQGGMRLVYTVEVEEAIRDKRDRFADDMRQDLATAFGFHTGEGRVTREEVAKLVDKVKISLVDTNALRLEFKDPADTSKIDDRFTKKFLTELSMAKDGAKVSFKIRPEEESRIRDRAVAQAKETVNRRVDGMGLREASVTTRDEDIIIEVPGSDDASFEEIKKTVSETARLEFKLLDDEADFFGRMKDDALPVGENLSIREEPAPAGPGKRVTNRFALMMKRDSETMNQCLERLKAWVRTLNVPDDHTVSYEPITRYDPDTGKTEDEGWRTVYLHNRAELTGDYITDAMVARDTQSTFGGYYVAITFSPAGADRFEEVTGANVQRRFAIILDDKVNSTPVIKGKIGGGRASITLGSGDPERQLADAKKLELVLRSGALPAPIAKSNDSRIGPTLGEDAINKGATGALVGSLLVLVFMIVYYRKAGLIADAAVLFNLVLQMAILASFSGTMSLPGIAGLALSIGMAVDANVLINERIREELRADRSVRAAIEAGYDKAFASIVDGHVTVFITGLILAQFGTGPVKGFAITLIIGMICSFFTGVFCTRVVFDWWARGKTNKISVGAEF